jgi:N-acetylmuramoyl-L-alanine amidase
MRFPSLLAIAVLMPALVFADLPLKGRKIVVDPGHGVINFERDLINSGKKTSNGLMEHKLTLEISMKLAEFLRREGATVYLTRTSNDYWRQAYTAPEDNKARILFANEVAADAFIAVHCDWNTSKKISGVTTLYEKDISRRLGDILQTFMVRKLHAKDRSLINDSFTVLDHAEMPAVIVETGFMSNRKEAHKLVDPEYQRRVAQALTDGLKFYFARN